MLGTVIPSPLRLLLTVLAIVLLAEAAVMVLMLWLLPGVDPFAAAITGAILSTIFSAPFLWRVIVRPLRSTAIAEHTRAATIISNAVDGIITGNAQGLVESLNPAAEQLFGYGKDEVVGRPLTLLMPERYRNAHQAGLERARVRGTSDIAGKTLELHGLRKDGSEFPMELTATSWKSEKGTLYTGFIRDITERKRDEGQLHLQGVALESAANAIMVTDREGRIVWVNPAFTRLTGYTQDEVLGQNPRLLKSGQHDQASFQNLWETILSGQVWHGETINRRKDGSLYTEEQTITPVRSIGGQIDHFIAIKSDITERKRLDEALFHRTAQLDALRAATVEITRELDITALLGLIARWGAELLEAKSSVLYLWDGKAQVLSAEAWSGLGEWVREVRLGYGEEIAGTVAQHRTGMIVNEYRTSPYASAVFIERTGITTAIAEPLMNHGRLVGVLMITNEETGKPFVDDHRRVLRLFAVQAAIAIENARLYKEVQVGAQFRTVLAELAREFTAILDPATLFSLLCERMATFFRVDGCYLWVSDAAGREHVGTAAFGHKAEAILGLRVSLDRDDSISVKAARTMKAEVIQEVATSELAGSSLATLFDSRSLLALPLIAKQRVMGVVVLSDIHRTNRFDAALIQRAEIFAGQAAVALDSAGLYSSLKERAERIAVINRLTSIINSSLDLGEVYEAFAREVKQLIPFDRMGIVVPDDSGEGLILSHLVGKQPSAGWRGTHWPKRARTGIDWVMSKRQPHISRDLIEERPYAEDEFLLKEGIRSVLRLPLVAKGQAVGALFLDSVEPARFSERDLEILVPLGEQLAIAIENAQLHAETKQRGQEVTKLYEVTRQLASSLELDPLLDQITGMVLELLGAEASGIYRYDDARGGLVFSRGLHLDPELTRNLVLAPGEGISGRVFQERRPVWTRDRFTDPSLKYAAAARRLLRGAPRAALGVPISSGGTVSGVLMAYFLLPHDYTPSEIQLLSALADQAAIAIENARLHADLGESKRKIENLYEMSVAMQEQVVLKERLELILTGARTVLGFERINILLPDAEMKMLKAAAAVGVGEPLERIRVPLGPEGGGIAKAFLERREIIWDGSGPVPEEWRLAHPFSEIQAFRSKTFAIVPLIVRGAAIGVVGADNKLTRMPISAEAVHLLKTFASQAALAIDNARLYDEVSGYAKGLEQKVEERTRVLKETQTQLVQSGKLAAIGTLVAGVAHELNQPLMVIRGYAQELLTDARIGDEDVREDLRRIERQTARMVAIITNLRDFSRQSKGKRQPTDLNHVVGHSLDFLEQQLRPRNIDVVQQLDTALPSVWMDPLQIEQVIVNLVTNACDAMGTLDRGAITIRTEPRQDGFVALTVTDTGPGIPPDLRGRIFDPFFTTKEVGKGTGLGLSICHGIIEEHRGEIRVESPVAEGRGTRFTILLPQSLRDPGGRDQA